MSLDLNTTPSTFDSNTTASPLADFFDSKIFAGIATWHALSFVCSIILIILVFLCCCISFRIPRTKQEIEADYIRKLITRKFRKQLNIISDSEMEELDLTRAIEKVQFHLMSEEEKATFLKLKSEPQIEVIENTEDTKSESPKERLISDGTDDLKRRTSEQQLKEKFNSSTLSTRLVTIVNAFSVLRPKKGGDGKAKQFTV